MSKSPNEVVFVVVVKKINEAFRSCEGGSKGCKNGWVPFQHQLLVFFFSYSFASTLFMARRFVSFFPSL
jgi:hypothetical protein